jgi:DHA1 family bicyclomycin/chloramphenicol resistance-like MFS transporter
MATRRSFMFYAVTLGILTMMMPLGTDIFLASMPAFARDYGMSIGAAELTLAAFFAGNAAGQIVWGPLSDRFGRKPIIVVAVAAYFLSAAAIALSDNFTLAMILRVVQGAAASSGRILANAVSRDLYDREKLAQLISFVMAAGALSAIFTGPLGGFIADHFDWQAAFVVPAVYAALTLLLFLVWYDETIVERNPLAIRPLPMLSTMAGIARNRVFAAYVLTSGCAMMGLSAFLNSGPGLLIGLYGLTPGTFGYLYALLPVGFIAGSILSARYGGRLSSDAFLIIGTSSMAAAGLAMLAFAIFGLPDPRAMVVPMLPYMFGFACIIPQCSSGALTPFGRTAGTASSLQGFTQSMMGATVSVTLALTANGTLYPMAIAIAASGIASIASYMVLIRRMHRPVAPVGAAE